MLSLKSEDKFVKLQAINSLSIEKAMEGEQMSRVTSQTGEIDTAKLIYILLDDLRVSLGVEASADLSDSLIGASFRIMKEFWFMKFDEIVLCLSGCKEGKYGKYYGKLSTELIFQWLNEYDRQRTERCDSDHLTAKDSLSASVNDRSPEPTFVKSVFEKAIDDRVEKRIKAYKKKRKE